MYLDPLRSPRQFKVTVPKVGNMEELSKALAQLADLEDHTRLVVTDVYNHRFHKIYSPEDQMSHILDRDDIFV